VDVAGISIRAENVLASRFALPVSVTSPKPVAASVRVTFPVSGSWEIVASYHAEKFPQLVHANLIDLASQIVDNRARNGRITYYYSKRITNLGLTESGRTKNHLRKT
jgi:hypothetical protein